MALGKKLKEMKVTYKYDGDIIDLFRDIKLLASLGSRDIKEDSNSFEIQNSWSYQLVDTNNIGVPNSPYPPNWKIYISRNNDHLIKPSKTYYVISNDIEIDCTFLYGEPYNIILGYFIPSFIHDEILLKFGFNPNSNDDLVNVCRDIKISLINEI
jgi:hypothetical protein